MEKQLFSWEGWDEFDVSAYYFYDVKLKCDIGDYSQGHEFKGAAVNFNDGTIEFFDGSDEAPVMTVRISLNIDGISYREE